MGFEKIDILIVGVLIAITIAIFVTKFEKVFYTKIKSYWFYNRSTASKVSSILWILSILVFLISLGDLRGKEQIVESSISHQKTVILIDSSLSMLAEDIRPNRFRKAGVLARHLIRNSYGHQVALSVFSDTQKKIVPFTDDIDILESRLQTLMSSVPSGGSSMSLAIAEAVQYFKTESGYSTGNIVLLTDGEEHNETNITVPDSINLAVIGVGTEAGGKIPLRRKNGSFSKYKQWDRKEVITKLNKEYFNNLVANVKNGKVWFAQSYSLPTEEILSYLTTRHKEEFSKGSFRQRPVLGYPLITLGIILFILSVIFSRFKSFIPLVLVLVCLNIRAQEYIGEEIKEVNPAKEQLLNKFKKGEISKSEKLYLAQIYSKEKDGAGKAIRIYEESLKKIDKEKNEDIFNYGTALLKDKKIKEGIEIYKYLDENRSLDKEMKKYISEHINLALKKQEQKKQQDKKDKENQKNKKDKKDKNENQKDKNENQKDKKGDKGQDQKNKGSSKDKEKKSKNGDSSNKNKEDKKKKNKKESKDEKNKGEDQKNKKDEKKAQDNNWEKIKSDAQKKKRTSKVRGVLKQIMNDDSNLQRKFLDTSSDKNNGVKDW